MTKLKRRSFKAWEKSREKAEIYETQITSRIDYILKFIFSELGGCLYDWTFDTGSEDLFRNVADGGKEIGFFFFEDAHLEEELIFKIGDRYYEGGNFPKRWLFEDFEEELREGIQAVRDEIGAEEDDEAVRLRKESEARAAALEKLTPAERKLLGLAV